MVGQEVARPPKAGAGESGQLDSSRGWMVVGSAMLATFAVFGVAYSFGAFFSAMSESFNTGKGKTTLLFGIANFVYFVGGVFTGRISDRVGPRPLLLAAAASLGVGLWLTSIVDRLWLGYLTYGLGVGIAVACAYVPMVSTVGAWFAQRRTLAVGLAVAGIGLGSLTASYVSPDLIDAHGWRGTYRIYAVVGVVLLLAAFLLAQRAPSNRAVAPAQATSLRQAASNSSFRYLWASMFVMSQGLFVPFVFLPAYARNEGVSSGSASVLVGLIGGSSIFGRLIFGMIGGRFGVLGLYQMCTGSLALTLVLWLTSGGRFSMLVAFAVLFGAVYGGFIALAPAVTAQVYGIGGLGSVLGALYTSAGFGGIGLYLMGEHIEASGSYSVSIAVSMLLALVAAGLLFPLHRSSS